MNTAFFALLIAYLAIGLVYSFYAVHVWCTEEKCSLLQRFTAFPFNRGGDGMAPLAEMLLDGHAPDWTLGRVVYQLGVTLFWPAKVAMIVLICAMYAPYAMLFVTVFFYYVCAHALGFNPRPQFSRTQAE